MIEAYFITLLGVIAAQASPGPNLIAVASASLGRGRTSGIFVTLGISTGMLFWALAVAFGLGALFTQYPGSLTLLKFVGGAYLIWLASRSLRSAWQGGDRLIQSDRTDRSNLANWKRGMFVVLTNPKAALMWSAVGTVLFAAELTPWQVALFGPIGATSGFIIYGGYSILFSTRSANQLYKRSFQFIEIAFSVCFGVLGGKLIIDGVDELRG